MNDSQDISGKHGKGRRFRGGLSGNKGKAVGVTSIVIPVLGYIVNDLRKPDSVVRKLVGSTVNALLFRRTKNNKALDITDKVEVEVGNTKTNIEKSD